MGIASNYQIKWMRYMNPQLGHKARILRDFSKSLTPLSEFFDTKLWSTEKTKSVKRKEIFRGFQKLLIFSFLEIFYLF